MPITTTIAALLARYAKAPETSTPVSTRLNVTQRGKLDRLAKAHGTTNAHILRVIVASALNGKPIVMLDGELQLVDQRCPKRLGNLAGPQCTANIGHPGPCRWPA